MKTSIISGAVNAGAIMIASLIKPEFEDSARFSYCMNIWDRLCAPNNVTYDNTVFLSERNSADTNFALAYLMKGKNAFDKGIQISRALEFYFQCCSIESTAEGMSVIAATLANGGTNPLTGDQIFHSDTVK